MLVKMLVKILIKMLVKMLVEACTVMGCQNDQSLVKTLVT
jgi:hypothetical protein